MQEPAVLEELGFTRDRTPAVSTLHKVFSSMDTDSFESVLGEWIESRLVTGEEAIAVDGKALRGIHKDQTPAARLLSLVRGHWGIENRLRYVRDVTMGEDGSQARTDSAPQMMAAVRNLALNILRLLGERNIALRSGR